MGFRMAENTTGIPRTAVERRKRFATLDGLRGFAAAVVLLIHCQLLLGGSMLFPHGRLAVDFFFLLSGFVVSYAYSHRLRRGLRYWTYIWLRITRLYPLIIIGTALGAVSFLITGTPVLSSIAPPVLSSALLGALGLPTLRGGLQLFPLNPPEWSLFYELIASAAFGVLFRVRLVALSFLAVVALVLLTVVDHSRQGLFAVTRNTDFVSGFARVLFPFIAGMWLNRLYESETLRVTRIPVWLAPLVLACAFLVPHAYHGNWVGDIFSVGIVFPLVLVLGLEEPTSNWGAWIAEAAGGLSYPLYMVHFPVIATVAWFFRNSSLHSGEKTAVAATLAVAIAYVAKKIDDAIQRALKGKGSRERSMDLTRPSTVRSQ